MSDSLWLAAAAVLNLAGMAGLALAMVTLLRPERRARGGTEAEISTVPVAVAPTAP